MSEREHIEACLRDHLDERWPVPPMDGEFYLTDALVEELARFPHLLEWLAKEARLTVVDTPAR